MAQTCPSFKPKTLIFVEVISVDGVKELSYTTTFSINVLHEFMSVAVMEKLPEHKLV